MNPSQQDPGSPASPNAEATRTPGALPANDIALLNALALTDFGPSRDSDRPHEWIGVAHPMLDHCQGHETVELAAARIIAAELRERTSHIVSELGLLRPEWVADQSEGFRSVMESVIRKASLPRAEICLPDTRCPEDQSAPPAAIMLAELEGMGIRLFHMANALSGNDKGNAAAFLRAASNEISRAQKCIQRGNPPDESIPPRLLAQTLNVFADD